MPFPRAWPTPGLALRDLEPNVPLRLIAAVDESRAARIVRYQARYKHDALPCDRLRCADVSVYMTDIFGEYTARLFASQTEFSTNVNNQLALVEIETNSRFRDIKRASKRRFFQEWEFVVVNRQPIFRGNPPPIVLVRPPPPRTPALAIATPLEFGAVREATVSLRAESACMIRPK